MNQKGQWRFYSADDLKAFAATVAATSQRYAARLHDVSLTTVRRAMRAHGVTPRRPGNYTVAEAMAQPRRAA